MHESQCKGTCESTGLSQKKGAPRHEEKESCLQQGEVPQLSELGHVMTQKSRSKTKSGIEYQRKYGRQVADSVI